MEGVGRRSTHLGGVSRLFLLQPCRQHGEFFFADRPRKGHATSTAATPTTQAGEASAEHRGGIVTTRGWARGLFLSSGSVCCTKKAPLQAKKERRLCPLASLRRPPPLLPLLLWPWKMPCPGSPARSWSPCSGRWRGGRGSLPGCVLLDWLLLLRWW